MVKGSKAKVEDNSQLPNFRYLVSKGLKSKELENFTQNTSNLDLIEINNTRQEETTTNMFSQSFYNLGGIE